MNPIITNRELLRNYRKLRMKLARGEVKKILIKQMDGMVFRFEIETPAQTAFERMVEHIKKHPIKGIKRLEEDLFDERK